MSTDSTLTIEIRDHVMSVGLNRPAKRNAFNLRMMRELGRAYTDYENDRDLRCLVLFAHGDHFTGGLDLAEVGPAVASGEPLYPAGSLDPMSLLDPRRTKPVVCGVQGWCLTMGVELLLASDIRIAASDTRFAQMEVKRGIMPFGGATMRLPQVAGWGNAMRWLLTGGEFGADEALRIGLVSEVVEPGRVRERAEELAAEVASQAPLAVQALIKACRTALEQGHQAALEGLVDHARALMTTEDAVEGMRSFLDRRQARFQGR